MVVTTAISYAAIEKVSTLSEDRSYVYEQFTKRTASRWNVPLMLKVDKKSKSWEVALGNQVFEDQENIGTQIRTKNQMPYHYFKHSMPLSVCECFGSSIEEIL